MIIVLWQRTLDEIQELYCFCIRNSWDWVVDRYYYVSRLRIEKWGSMADSVRSHWTVINYLWHQTGPLKIVEPARRTEDQTPYHVLEIREYENSSLSATQFGPRFFSSLSRSLSNWLWIVVPTGIVSWTDYSLRLNFTKLLCLHTCEVFKTQRCTRTGRRARQFLHTNTREWLSQLWSSSIHLPVPTISHMRAVKTVVVGDG